MNYPLTMLIAQEFNSLNKMFLAKWKMLDVVAYNILYDYCAELKPQCGNIMRITWNHHVDLCLRKYYLKSGTPIMKYNVYEHTRIYQDSIEWNGRLSIGLPLLIVKSYEFEFEFILGA